MPKNKTVKKLVAGDKGYDPDVAHFEVTETRTVEKVTVTRYSVVEIEQRISNAKDQKASAIESWNDKIAALEQLKMDLLAES